MRWEALEGSAASAARLRRPNNDRGPLFGKNEHPKGHKPLLSRDLSWEETCHRPRHGGASDCFYTFKKLTVVEMVFGMSNSCDSRVLISCTRFATRRIVHAVSRMHHARSHSEYSYPCIQRYTLQNHSHFVKTKTPPRWTGLALGIACPYPGTEPRPITARISSQSVYRPQHHKRMARKGEHEKEKSLRK